MIKKIAAAAITAGIISTISLSAFAEDQGVTATIMIGKTIFDDAYKTDEHFSGAVGYRFDSPWGLELVYGNADTKLASTPGTGIDYRRYHLDAIYNFEDTNGATPYVSFGAGESRYHTKHGRDDDETMVNIAAGFKYFFLEQTAFRGEIKLFHGFDDNEAQAAISVGLHHVFSTGSAPPAPKPAAKAPLDSDRDGVIDNKDSCLSTPRGASVDAKGCPVDSDRDGIPDYKDQCPDTTDRAATIDKKGCYVVLTEKVTVKLNVEFNTNSAAVRPSHKEEVRRVYEFMKSYPLTKVTIEGHTDDRGSATYNKNLSQRRANTIANILISDFGVSASRVSAKGYGEEKPIASNKTTAGQQKNRRVLGVVEAMVETIKKD